MSNTLNTSQREFTDAIYAAIEDSNHDNGDNHNFFFLEGPGGSGKTYTYNTLIRVLRGRGSVVIAVAWTGIASTLLIGGATCHSMFKLPVPITANSTCNISINSPHAEHLRKAALIIWDEAPMASYHALNAVDICLQDIMHNTLPFGGKVLILGGDFRQVLPIVPHAKKEVVITTSIRYSTNWDIVKRFTLQQNMRADYENIQFSEWLLKLGNGTLDNENDFSSDSIRIPDHCLVEGSLIHAVFGHDILRNPSTFNSAILCPKNEETFDINNDIVQNLPGRTMVYFSVDKVEADPQDDLNVPIEYLNSITPSGLPPHELILKVGVTVMLLRNLQTGAGLCNGTRLRVIAFTQHLIKCKILSGPHSGKQTFVPRMSLSPSEAEFPFKMTRFQFPIRLAFAITINKAQGQTFDKIGIYLPQPVFSHGQLYVAFSRVRRFSDVKVLVVNYKNLQGRKRNVPGTYTTNVVYNEIL